MEEVKERGARDLEDVRNMLQEYEAMAQSLGDKIETSHKSIEDKFRLLEEQIDKKSFALQDKFATYKSYVGRLRKDVHALERKFEDSQENLVGKVSSELDVAEKNLNVLAQHFATCK
jgi:chromosome segregation ATPase